MRHIISDLYSDIMHQLLNSQQQPCLLSPRVRKLIKFGKSKRIEDELKKSLRNAYYAQYKANRIEFIQ